MFGCYYNENNSCYSLCVEQRLSFIMNLSVMITDLIAIVCVNP